MDLDDGACSGDGDHAWRLVGVTLIAGHGAPTEYQCVRCPAVLYVGPDDPMPASA